MTVLRGPQDEEEDEDGDGWSSDSDEEEEGVVRGKETGGGSGAEASGGSSRGSSSGGSRADRRRGPGELRARDVLSPPGGVVRLLVLVSTRAIKDGEELLQNYRMNPHVVRPDWWVRVTTELQGFISLGCHCARGKLGFCGVWDERSLVVGVG